jgi:hypothetical protein
LGSVAYRTGSGYLMDGTNITNGLDREKPGGNLTVRSVQDHKLGTMNWSMRTVL